MSLREVRRVECDECRAVVLVGEDQYPQGWVELEVRVRKQGEDPANTVLPPVAAATEIDCCGLRCAKAFLLKFADKLPSGDKDAP